MIPTAAHETGISEKSIVANTTFILKPFLNVPEAPAAFARTHDVTWGDTIVVRETGPQRLGSRARELFVAGGG